jgi:hypothetical protein
MAWNNASPYPSKSYTCGYCGEPLASQLGFSGSSGSIYICHFCEKPTYFDIEGRQSPGVPYGDDVADISDASVKDLYEEARRCTSGNAYTAAVLSCRKLLMHIAVAKGAKAGKNFIEYVDYLADNHYVPPNSRDWVDHIRKKGNEANHEIVIMKPEDAEELLLFIAMLLKFIY